MSTSTATLWRRLEALESLEAQRTDTKTRNIWHISTTTRARNTLLESQSLFHTIRTRLELEVRQVNGATLRMVSWLLEHTRFHLESRLWTCKSYRLLGLWSCVKLEIP